MKNAKRGIPTIHDHDADGTENRWSDVPSVRATKVQAEREESLRVPEVLSPRVADDLSRAFDRSQPIPNQRITYGDVLRVGRYKKAMEHYSEAMGHGAAASKHAVTIATNTAEIKRVSLNLWEYGEGILTKVENHRLERDRLKQERFVLKQTEGAQVAIAHDTLDAQLRRIGYQKLEDHTDHVIRMNEKREKQADHAARMKLHDLDVQQAVKAREMQFSAMGTEGAISDEAKRETIARRAVLDVAEQHVICDQSHLYHPAAAIWYWGARRRGDTHDIAAAATVARLVDRMTNDPITLSEASKDFKKWTQMEEELRDAEYASRIQNEIAQTRSERDRQRATILEHERLKTEAERERRLRAEAIEDTFAGGDVGDDEN
jgi:hypothetical protein